MTSSVSVHTRLSLSLDLRSRPDSLILVQIQFITVKRNSALLSQYSRIKIIQMFPYFTTISNEPSTVLSSLHSHSFEIRGLCWNLNLFSWLSGPFSSIKDFGFYAQKSLVGPVCWPGQPCFYWYKF